MKQVNFQKMFAITRYLKKQKKVDMESAIKAIETTGRINTGGNLILDENIPVLSSTKVRVIILVPEYEDIGETEWLHAASNNPAFDFLKEPEEDIYTLADGKPFHD